MADEARGLDLTIVGGTVVDGTGRPAFAADVGIAEGRIVSVGALESPARRTIDAGGLVVAPGFIDVHAHDDMAVVSSPTVDFKVMQGVTTDVVGNCGVGAAPATPEYRQYYDVMVHNLLGPAKEFAWSTTAEYYSAVESAGPSLNIASYVPHGTLRFVVMGMAQRVPTDEEMGQMKELLEEGLEAGAIGLSTGLIYPPGIFATTEELIELAKVVARHGGLYASHIRDEGERLLEAVAEAIRIGEEAGLPVEMAHHKAAGHANWGLVSDSLRLVEEARARGVDVTVDVYPYTAASTLLAVLLTQIGAEGERADGVMVTNAPKHPQFEGKTLSQMGEMQGLSPQEAGLRLVQEEPSAVAISFEMCEDDVRQVMRHPFSMFGSDGLPSGAGKPHPRLYGTFARVLGTYVRQEGILGLEEAVRKMTDLPARKHGLEGRGQIAPGYWADVTTFDPQRVDDVASYQDPRRHPEGIRHVIVNGQVVVDRGRHTEASAGRVLRASR